MKLVQALEPLFVYEKPSITSQTIGFIKEHRVMAIESVQSSKEEIDFLQRNINTTPYIKEPEDRVIFGLLAGEGGYVVLRHNGEPKVTKVEIEQ